MPDPTADLQPVGDGKCAQRPWCELLLPLIVAAGFFGVYLVNLGRQEFVNASENVVIQAAVETRRGGPIWIPNMLGRPRVNKPPLATWIAAAAITDNTVTALRQGSVESRQAAYRSMAVEARWPSVLCSCLTLLGVYALGRLIKDRQLGLWAMAVCGSTVLLLRFGRMANTDVQIMLWVTWANVCLALAVLRNRWWLGCAGAGACIGLAIMSKGPVALIQSLVPFMAFGLYRRFVPVDGLDASPRVKVPTKVAATAVGIILCLAIALPWPISVMLSQPGMVAHWLKEITRSGATDQTPDPWWGYVSYIANMLPWMPLAIGGLCFPFIARFRRSPVILAWMLVVVPIFVMSFASDKNERYGLPMVPATSLLVAYLAVEYARNRASMTASDRLAENLQWIVGFGMAAAILAGAVPIRGKLPFYSWTAAIIGTSAALGAMLIAFLGRKRTPWLAVAGPAAMALIVYHMVMIGYTAASGGQSEYRPLAMRADVEHPEAELLFYDGGAGRHVPTDLAIYAGTIVRGVKVDMLAQSSQREQVLFAIQQADAPVRQFDGWTCMASVVAEHRLVSSYVRKP